MSLRRVRAVFALELRHYLRRPIFWMLILLLGFTAWGLSSGNVRIASGDSDVGGTKAWITSQFAVANLLAVLVLLYYTFFLSVAAGMIVIRDDEERVGELLHSTALTPSEYVWGKFAAVLAAFAVILLLHLGLHAFFNHVTVSAESAEFIGPFAASNYLWPAVVFGVPMLVFVAGASFWLGERTRRPIPVFALPAALLLECVFFLWDFDPAWLDHRINRALMLVDPTGFRWLSETWLEVDRGVAFYNQAPIGLDAPFVASRFAFVALGCFAVAWSARHLAESLRGVAAPRARKSRVTPATAGTGFDTLRPDEARPLAALGMQSGAPGVLRGMARVAAVELRELKSQPGLYLFVPLILLQTLGNALLRLGAFDTPLLSTPGTLALGSLNTLTLLVCLLLLFYTVESLERERGRGLGQIYYATPVKSLSILLGKSLANSFVGVVVLAGALLANLIVLLIQGKVGFDLRPFAILWGVALVPTFIVWTTFVAMLFSLTASRFTTYGIALGVMIFTGYMQVRGHVNWVGNWNLWSALTWSDMDPLELARAPLFLNRALYLSLALLFAVIAVRFFPRRSLDAATLVDRLRPRVLARAALRLAPLVLVPLALGIWLYVQVQAGFQGDRQEKASKDYWRKNIATWKDAPLPSIRAVDLDLDLEPHERSFRVRGSFTLVNDHETAMRSFPVTPGFHFEKLAEAESAPEAESKPKAARTQPSNVAWTLDGVRYEPDNRAGLHIVTPPAPLAPGATLVLGFEHRGTFPKGITRNGGGTSEFILPGGVVLTSFSPSFVPVLGMIEGVGVDEDNESEARVWAEDFHEGVTRSAFGSNTPYTTRLRISAPDEYTINSVGTLESDVLDPASGRRTVVWASDHPVNFFNVVAGRWDVRRGEGTALYYHPEHTYNVDEMSKALDGARRHFSEWFHPFPWRELKLSEFPAHAGYAQGFPTNITFSEGIGFLTQSDPRAATAFLVTAHETAHQWWGNILVPGRGPGGNILSEGMSHFSTILLMEEVLGLRERVEFCKRIESRYADNRQSDSERPMVRIDGSRPGDETVTYDKGGWVFWMLLNRMGRERTLEGLRAFIAQYEHGPDHPVLQDFVASLRPFAPDAAAYEEFVQQWFFDVVVAEYALAEQEKTAVESDGNAWDVSVRVTNKGTSRMPVEIAATRGERFPDDELGAERDFSKPREPATNEVAAAASLRDQEASQDAVTTVVAPAPSAEPYREQRTTLTLGPGESQVVELRCDFEPEELVVDPDALVLQLERKLAIVRF